MSSQLPVPIPTLMVKYRPPSNSTYLMPTAPDLSPNVSSSSSSGSSSAGSSSGYSSSLSAAVSLSLSTSATSATSAQSYSSDHGDLIGPPSLANKDHPSAHGINMGGMRRQTSRPSLRHMPSWGSFASYRSGRSRGSIISTASVNDGAGITSKPSIASLSSCADCATGVHEDADDESDRISDEDQSATEANLHVTGSESGGLNTRKGSGGTVLHKALKKLSMASLSRYAASEQRDLNEEKELVDRNAQIAYTVKTDDNQGQDKKFHIESQETAAEGATKHTDSAASSGPPVPGPLPRAGTPLNHPSYSDFAHSRKASLSANLHLLPTMLEAELSPTSSSHSPGPEEYFTPPTMPTALLETVQTLPKHTSLPRTQATCTTTVGHPLYAESRSVARLPRPIAYPPQRFTTHYTLNGTAGRPPVAIASSSRPEHLISGLPSEHRQAVGYDTSAFNCDIFSPRVQRAPMLKGLTDSLPVSPLELPSPQVTQSLMNLVITSSHKKNEPLALKDHATDTAISPTMHASSTMPSLGQIATTSLDEIGPRSPQARPSTGSGIIRGTPSPSNAHTRLSPLPSHAAVHRLPRASIPGDTGGTNSHIATNNGFRGRFPKSERYGSSAFSDSTATSPTPTYSRRHSALIRPPILHTPTPPSLIHSPRSLGFPLIPCGLASPHRMDTINGAPPDVLPPIEGIPDLLPSSRVRRNNSLKRKTQLAQSYQMGALLPLSLSASSSAPTSMYSMISPTKTGTHTTAASAGLGLGPMNGAGTGISAGTGVGTGTGSGFRKFSIPIVGDNICGERSEEHVATPGTFGLHGEAEKRMMIEGVNPYFA